MSETTNVGYDTEHDRDEGLARDCLTLLCHAYPGHEWWVEIKGGCIVIKHLGLSHVAAMTLHYKKVLIDPETLRKAVVWSGGEFLERAGLARGKKSGQIVTEIEGVKPKHILPPHAQS